MDDIAILASEAGKKTERIPAHGNEVLARVTARWTRRPCNSGHDNSRLQEKNYIAISSIEGLTGQGRRVVRGRSWRVRPLAAIELTPAGTFCRLQVA